MTSSGSQTLPAPGTPLVSGDYILVPTAQYNQLVVGQHAPGGAGYAPLAPGAHHPYAPLPPHAPAVASGAYAPHPYWGAPPGSQLEAQITALVGALAADRRAARGGGDAPGASQAPCQPTPPSPTQERRYARKRRYDWDAHPRDEFESVYYPGERSPGPAAHGDGSRRSGPHRPSTTIADLMGAVTSLQQEVSQLRAVQTMAPRGAPAGAPAVYPGTALAGHQHYAPPVYPQYPSGQAVVSAALAPPQPVGYHPHPPVGLMQPQIVDAPHSQPCPPPAAAALAQTQQPSAEAARPVQSQQQPPPEATPVQSQPTQTVDASAATTLDAYRDDADIFVSQMMSNR
ncbi:capsid scaffold protein [Equid alphaherpesvirus 3]|nr:capsid scaffold protein [Equid alphaherpesvirus 3]AIL02952.1 capsid scaffold protein [Equid alphaherpesvirus 3]